MPIAPQPEHLAGIGVARGIHRRPEVTRPSSRLVATNVGVAASVGALLH
ncbi:hypothetical protein IU479_21245 [Nocardia abscessus]|nr:MULTISPECIES: hypothetical protein [Nocardia]MBF6220632.1 hypothetical protein [Nocardia abscessus]MDE1671913.1 hypothetical protein [Nocardia gipuzkoensis]